MRTVLASVMVLAAAGAVAITPVMAASPASAAPATRVAATPATCTITGTPGNDVLRGTSGDDVICGLGGDDRLIGQGGHDVLRGGPGRDVLEGVSGADVLDGGTGVDRLTGGLGRDTCAADPGDTRTDACTVDTTGPALAAVDIPAATPAGQRLTLTWSAADLSGVTNTNLFLGGPSGWVRWCTFGVPGELTTGDTLSGTYTATCDVPANAVAATYSVFVGASDTLGNQTSTQLGEVEVTGGSSDSAAPVVSDLSLPTTVTPGATITLTWRATDETGVDVTFPWVVGPGGNLIGTDGIFYGRPLDSTAVLVSGTATDGVYSTRVEVSPTAPAGPYTLRFSSRDVLGNHTYDPYLDAEGVEVAFTVS